MRKLLSAIVIALSASTALALTTYAAELSGGASGGGALQGGSGSPGSGVGIPGAIINNTTAEGIGADDTLGGAWMCGAVLASRAPHLDRAFHRVAGHPERLNHRPS